MAPRRLQHSFTLRPTKTNRFAEHIDGIHQLFLMQCWQHFVNQIVEIVIGFAGKLSRHRMGAKKRAAHADRMLLAKSRRHLQHFSLTGQIETITAFDFNRCDPFGQPVLQTFAGLLEQGIYVGGTGGGNSGDNAATGLGNVGVAGAIQAHFELIGAMTAVDQVGMAIDQTGCDQCALQINAFATVVWCQFGGADVLNAAIGDLHFTIFDEAVILAVHRAKTAVDVAS